MHYLLGVSYTAEHCFYLSFSNQDSTDANIKLFSVRLFSLALSALFSNPATFKADTHEDFSPMNCCIFGNLAIKNTTSDRHRLS